MTEVPASSAGRSAAAAAADDRPATVDRSGADGDRFDHRLVPIAAAAWTATWLGTAGRVTTVAVAGGLLLAVLLTALVRRSWLCGAIAIMIAGGFAAGALHQHALATAATARLAGESAVVTAEVVLADDPTVQPADGVRPAFLLVRAEVRTITGRGNTWAERAPVLITASGDAIGPWRRLPPGTRLRAVLQLAAAEPGDDIAAVARARGDPEVVAGPGAGLQLVERVRAGLRAAVAAGRPDQRALVPSLVLGDTQAMTAEVEDEFLDTGLTHLTAVSGANLAIMLAFLSVAARWAGVRGWWLRLIGLAGVVIFVALCRTDPSVLRAAAMGLVALASLGISGRARGLRTLCVAMITLLVVEPWLSRSIGFALSVLATGAIMLWAQRWAMAMQRWMPLLLAQSITVPLAAHLVTLPVAAAISGQVSVVGIVTNAIAGPFVAPATVLGFAAAGLSLLHPAVAGLVGWAACWVAQPILWTAHFGSALPGAARTWPTGPLALAVLGSVCLLLVLAMPRVLRRPWVAAVLAAAMIIAVVRAPAQPGWPPRDWVLVACDVGQGDGLVVRTGPRSAIVVDTGPDPKPMRRCLDQLGVSSVPLVILTHYHADHVDGLSGVLAGRRVGQVWVSPYPAPAPAAERVAALAGSRGIQPFAPEAGTRVRIGAAELSVVGPVGRVPDQSGLTAEVEGESSLENDLSLAALITVDGVRVLFTGDLEPDAQQAVIDSGADLRADVLKVPHHGSARQDSDFIAASGARLAITSAAADNSYGHPAPRTLRLLRSAGMTSLCTCDRGAIAVTGQHRKVAAVTERTDR